MRTAKTIPITPTTTTVNAIATPLDNPNSWIIRETNTIPITMTTGPAPLVGRLILQLVLITHDSREILPRNTQHMTQCGQLRGHGHQTRVGALDTHLLTNEDFDFFATTTTKMGGVVSTVYPC